MQETKQRKGNIGIAGAMAIGIGGMVGGGIFAVLGEAVSIARGATPIAFLLAGLIALVTANSYWRLSVRYPSQGGTVVFIHHAFGADFVTGSINFMLWLSYIVTLSLYAVAFGSYGLTFFTLDQAPGLRHALISTAIILPIAINLLNAELVSRTETAIVLAKLVLLAVVVAASVGAIDSARLSPQTWGSAMDVFTSGMVIFVAYEGFELIANAAEDVRDPKRTLPGAFFGSVVLVIVLYVVVAITTVGTVPAARIAEVRDYALAEAARPGLGLAGFRLVALAALLATLSAINATLYGNARLAYSLATSGELPRLLRREAWNRPAAGVLVSGTLALILANTVDLSAIAILASAGFLLIFGAVNLAAVVLSRRTGGGSMLPALGTAASWIALGVLLIHGYQQHPWTLGAFAGFVAVAVAFESIYPRIRERRLNLPARDTAGVGRDS
jgi:amino acid transporter